MIGVFDSGLGGLIVAKEILKRVNSPILYFGDTAHLPYGTKSKKAILNFSQKNTEFLIKKGAKIIVVACNTSSAVAGDFLKRKYKIPIFDVIDPVVEKLYFKSKTKQIKKVGIIGTPTTIKSGIYQNKIKKIFGNQIKVYLKACPLLVPLIEEGWIYHKVTKEVLKEYLLPLKKKKTEALILGCTHYPLVKDLILKEIGEKVEILDSAKEVALKLEKFLKNNKIIKEKKKEIKIFLSDEGYNFEKMIKIIFKKPLSHKIINPL